MNITGTRRLNHGADSSNSANTAVVHRLPIAARSSRSIALTALMLLAGCQTGIPSDALSLKSDTAPTSIMVSVAKAAQQCWFKSRDSAFSGYRLANEVNSPAGRPRILLVPKRDPGALPLLVVQAEKKGSNTSGAYTDIQAFGPILASGNGKRITDDVRRWASGNSNCKAG